MVDADYPDTQIYFGPYKDCRYHLQDYMGRVMPHKDKEIFNYTHSSLPNITKRCLGVLKSHFPILKRMALYSCRLKCSLLSAVTLRSYIRQEAQSDWLLEEHNYAI